MPVPTLRFLAMPLAALGGLVALALQTSEPRPVRETALAIREQVVDCSRLSATDLCVIGETAGS